MTAPFSISDGKFLVNLARDAIEKHLASGLDIDPPAHTPKHLLEKRESLSL